MALFKISRGGEKNLPVAITDGWAYFTPDTKGFFIDVNSTIGDYSYNERIEINEKDLIFYPCIESTKLDGYNRYIYSLPQAYSGINYDLSVELDESQINAEKDIGKLFEYRKMVQQKQVSYYLSNAQQAIVFQVTGALTQPIYLKATLIPKKKTLANFMTDLEGSSGMGAFDFYSGSTWREFIEYYTSTVGNNDYNWRLDGSTIYVDLYHPWYGDITITPSGIFADDVIMPNYHYSFARVSGEECCFIPSTLVQMSDGTKKPIENIQVGDLVESYDINSGDSYTTKVNRVIVKNSSTHMAKITLDDKTVLEMTDYHPLYTAAGWKSLTRYRGYEKLSEADVVKTYGGWANIVSIERYILDEPIVTYTLDVIGFDEESDRDDNTNDNFYANGVVAHNASCPI